MESSAYIWVVLLALLIPLVLRYIYYPAEYIGIMRPEKIIQIADLTIAIKNEVTFKIEKNGRTKSEGVLADGMPASTSYTTKEENNTVTIDFKDYATLSVTAESDNKHTLYKVHWKRSKVGSKYKLGDSFSLQKGHWYGAGHVWDQPWPLEKWNTCLGPFVTGEAGPFSFMTKYWQLYGGVQERLWLCSTGIGLWVDFDVPLFVSTNYKQNGLLKLVSKYKLPYQNSEKQPTWLSYTIVEGQDVKSVFDKCSGNFFPLPKGIPSRKIFQYPIWSTWAMYKTKINQKLVLQFADDIRKYGFKDSQIEIDDDWTPHYGDFDFDSKKFPDPKKMVDQLKEKGFRVALWMHPFISPLSNAFWELKEKGLLVRMAGLNIPDIVSWWNGYAAQIDVTCEAAREWYKKSLKKLQTSYGIDTFKFDAGDAQRLDSWSRCSKPLDNPNHYSTLYAELCQATDGDMRATELRVGTGCQQLPMFFRLQDKDSNWGSFNGLATVIPHVLTQGLLGYPFVLPDMIGGNAYSIFGGNSYPARELYIRWIQVNALMPAMQFSVVPWHYDDEVVEIAKKMCDLHEQFSERIVSLAEEAVVTGAPICRPLWWTHPDDEVALTISTEFLLGNDILVAPVLEQGATSRDIYLPAGQWQDAMSNILEGSTWHRDYPAPLDTLPYFTLVPDRNTRL